MNQKTIRWICQIILALFCVGHLQIQTSFGAGAVAPASMQGVIAEIRQAATERNFSRLRKFVSNSDTLYWGICNSEGSVKFSVDEMVRQLTDDSKRVDIHVGVRPDGGIVETTGWPGENAFLYFQFTKIGDNWKWLGVCESPKRPFDYRPAQE